jgi:hypothetical protein
VPQAQELVLALAGQQALAQQGLSACLPCLTGHRGWLLKQSLLKQSALPE